MADPNVYKAMTLKDTTDLIARVHKAAANPIAIAPHYDGTAGEYDNLEEWWSLNRDGKVYGVKIPTWDYSNDPKGIKTRDNVGLVIEPSTETVAGRDDYATLNAFKVVFCNATVDDDGVPHVTAIEGDGRFKRDGSNGDVWSMVCNGYYSITVANGYKEILWSDSPQEGFKTMTGGAYPDGTRRPYLLFACYVACLDSGNVPHSWSGHMPDMQFGSHDRQVAYAKLKGAGYSGRTVQDNFYVQMMLMLKYATQNSDGIGGCSDYNLTYTVAAAEASVNRVQVTTAQAANFVVGSAISIGTSTDRGQDACHAVADRRKVTKIEAVSSDVTAIYFDGDPVTVSTGDYVVTMPWPSGSCDNILGNDGYPVSGKAVNRQPYRIQGIECFVGLYESLADVICQQVKDSDDAGRIELYKTFNAKNYGSAINSNTVKLDMELPARDASNNNAWHYAEDWRESTVCPGFLVPQGTGATSTTGTCDAVYSSPITSAGLRMLQCFGYLSASGFSGAFCAHSGSALSGLYWGIGGRLSALGVTKPGA